ncbi:MAG: Protein translocase subunit SecA [Verrucomicrobiae bacterium]|nr:Protein translocase subunit SecA [Verrucomicrobiae bacterium]
MVGWILKKIVGSKNQRELKKLWPLVAQINEFEAQYQKLSDDQLRAKTAEFKARIEAARKTRGVPELYAEARKLDGELNSEDAKTIRRRAFEQEQAILDEILPEAFAAVKNTCRRLCGREWLVRGRPYKWEMVPFDVQLLGGIALHKGNIAEMATGEGKTLVATSPLYLNALSGYNVHLITVNDYLAARDSEWMGEIYKFLGLTVGCIQHDQPPPIRRAQYACDITYGTNAEFGFDYLRDNGMATSAETQVKRGHFFAIVDEVDSILIDEARTPLIISGPSTVATHSFDKYKPQVAELVRSQTMLCNRYVNEAKQLLDTRAGKDTKQVVEVEAQAGRLLHLVKLGMPKNRQLAKMMEEPDLRKLLDEAELESLADSSKKELIERKEELFFTIDEKQHDSDLTEKGRKFLNPTDPEAFTIPDLVTALQEVDALELPDEEKEKRRQRVQQLYEERSEKIHNIAQLLRAYCLFEKDVEYVVQDGKILIVDEFTGRLMPGRRWSDGLHGAVEAKEGVTIERESQTLATITIQNYFRLYSKLAGMTGTAETEATEFMNIYKLGVLVIPTNRPCIRADENDVVYKSRREKYNAIIDEIEERNKKGQPMLVGTVSVDASEVLSRMLKRKGIPHNVLNAKYHQSEAEIVARAGQKNAVTIATNMAGRGTDIKLGEGVAEVGGLHVIGSERHEARRIDRQLRGRCARQGDPGSSRFFVSLEDDLMRLFASGKIANIMEKLGMKEGEELEHPLLNRSIETAQRRVEEHNFSIRKRTLEYDDVMNKQREVLYGFRNEVIQGDDPRHIIFDILEEVIEIQVETFCPAEKLHDEWDFKGLLRWANIAFPIGLRQEQLVDKTSEEVRQVVLEKVRRAYEAKAANEDPHAIKHIERLCVLSALDRLWQEHLYNMDQLRNAIGLRAYGQRDPLVEYKAEAFKMFEEMMASVKSEIASNVFRSASSLAAFEKFLSALPQQLSAPELNAGGAFAQPAQAAAPAEPKSDMVDEAIQAAATPVKRDVPKVGRNEPCPCGSGKKFKNCCGKNA